MMFQCGECDLQFSDPEHLANHMKVHMEVLLIQCSRCTKYYLNSSNTNGEFLCSSCVKDQEFWNLQDSARTKLGVPVSEDSVEVTEGKGHVDYLDDDYCTDSYSPVQETDHEEPQHPSSVGICTPGNMYADTFVKFVSNSVDTQASKQRESYEPKAVEYSLSAVNTEPKKKVVMKKPKRKKEKQSKETVGEVSNVPSASDDPVGPGYYGCSVCKMRFDKYDSLREHMRSHDVRPIKQYACGLCEYSCKLGTDLKRHLYRHTGEKTYKCKVCGKMFRVSQALSRHMKMHNGIKPHECEVCKKAFTELSKLRIHLRTHSGEKPYVCKYCNKTFANVTSRNTHQRTHTGERPYQCSRCEKSFNARGTLKEHSKLHLSEKPHVCDVCGKGFSQLRPFNNHRRLHTGEKPFKCSICDRRFRSNQTYSYHMKHHDSLKNNHKELEPEELKKLLAEDEKGHCKFCWKSFKNPEDLKQHSEIHVHDVPYFCEICEERFKKASVYKIHLGRKHLQCFHCGKICTNRGMLRTHKNQHVCQCRICKKTLQNPIALAAHYRAHTREKPFKCNHCGKMFRVKASLKMHHDFHSGAVAFVCEICGKILKTSTNLKLHMKSHDRR